MTKKLLLTFLILNWTIAPIAFAAQSQFQIDLSVTGPNDTTPPTQPTNLFAAAVSSSQINLSWTASTDNISVSFYKIYRDNVFVNTSASTIFSDTGLSSNTTYIYKVSAVDQIGNESVPSDPAQATTQAANRGGGGGSLLPIFNIQVFPETTGARITWNTGASTEDTVYFGETLDFEEGSIKESTFSTIHEIHLTDLSAGTLYYFRIDAQNESGITFTLPNQSFKTLGLPEGIPNPTNFEVTPNPTSASLSWTNPNDPNFSEVRIVRSETFFPSDYLDGKVIYEGNGQLFEDSDVEVGKTYYYTLFAKNKNGEYSSGVVGQVKIGTSPEIPPPDIYENLPKAPVVDPIIAALNFWDFDFIQEGKKINIPFETNIKVDGTKNLTVSISYDKIPEVLKSIVVTLKDPDNPKKVFSFILRVNKEKTLYTATIAPLGRSGIYATRIAIVDYKNRGLKATDGTVSVALAYKAAGTLGKWSEWLWILLAAIALAYATRKSIVVFKNRKERELKGA